MNFGIFNEIPMHTKVTQPQAFDSAFKVFHAAEDLGLDTIWLGESHFSTEYSLCSAPLPSPSPAPSPLVLGAFVSAPRCPSCPPPTP